MKVLVLAAVLARRGPHTVQNQTIRTGVSGIIALRRRTAAVSRLLLSPAPTPDLGHIVAVPTDVLLVVDQQEWVVIKVNLTDRQVVGGPPVSVHFADQFRRKRIVHLASLDDGPFVRL